MKKVVKLSGMQLGCISIAINRKLFPKPVDGAIARSIDNEFIRGQEYSNVYFEQEYFNLLQTKIISEYNLGKFARSNAEPIWISIMEALNNANNVNEILEETLNMKFGLF